MLQACVLKINVHIDGGERGRIAREYYRIVKECVCIDVNIERLKMYLSFI